jgi:hypothetical protein
MIPPEGLILLLIFSSDVALRARGYDRFTGKGKGINDEPSTPTGTAGSPNIALRSAHFLAPGHAPPSPPMCDYRRRTRGDRVRDTALPLRRDAASIWLSHIPGTVLNGGFSLEGGGIRRGLT